MVVGGERTRDYPNMEKIESLLYCDRQLLRAHSALLILRSNSDYARAFREWTHKVPKRVFWKEGCGAQSVNHNDGSWVGGPFNFNNVTVLNEPGDA